MTTLDNHAMSNTTVDMVFYFEETNQSTLDRGSSILDTEKEALPNQKTTKKQKKKPWPDPCRIP